MAWFGMEGVLSMIPLFVGVVYDPSAVTYFNRSINLD